LAGAVWAAFPAWGQTRTVVVDADRGEVRWYVYDNDRFDADDFTITQFETDRASEWFYDTRTSQWERRGDDRYGDDWTDRERRRVRGEVERVRTFRLFGDELLLARIQTDDGHEVRAILGPKDELRSFGLDRGDRVAVAGRPFLYQDREYLIAERIRTPRQTLLVRGDWYAKLAPGQYRETEYYVTRPGGAQYDTFRPATINGEIVDIFSRTYGNDLHMFADVRDSSGDIVRVDLGPWGKYRGSNLEPGDRINLTGQLAFIDGRQTLLADNVRVGYSTYTIDRFRGDTSSRVSGQVTATFQRYHNGTPHLVAHIESGGGNVIRADLGPQANLRGQTIRDGDIVTVDGSWAMIDGANTLVADRILHANRIIDVATTFGQPGRFDRTDRFTGEIRSLHRESHLGTEHLIATVKTDDNRVLTVDLGPDHRARAYNFDGGDRITFSGTTSTFNDRAMIVAHSIDAAGATAPEVRLTTFRSGEQLRGTVMGTEVRAFDGYDDDQLIVRLRLADGTIKTVVLGDADWYRNEDIETGDQLTFRASSDVNEASRLIATDVSVNGRFITTSSGGNR
jgi:hypothetical protein